MKNKSAVLDAICNAQLHFNEEPTMPSSKLSREALESFLMVYVKRFRNIVPVSETKNAFTTLDCTACGTTGIYVPNGGPCFRCKGKGHQDEADQKRNYGYDLNNRPSAAPSQRDIQIANGYDPDDPDAPIQTPAVLRNKAIAAAAAPTELEKAQDEVAQRLTGKSELYDEDDIPF